MRIGASESEGHLETLNVMLGVDGRHMKAHHHPRGHKVTLVDKSEKCRGPLPFLTIIYGISHDQSFEHTLVRARPPWC